MTKQNEKQQTAKIYAFPAQRRATSGSQLPNAKATAQHVSAPLPRIEFGRGWYHQAAIEEANEAHDRRRRPH